VTRRAHETGDSRTSISHHAQRVAQAVVNEPLGGISDEALWADHERLRAENAALWEAWAETGSLPEAKQHACAATGSAMGLSLGQMMTLLAIVLPHRAVRRVGQRWGAGCPRPADKPACCWQDSISSVSGGFWGGVRMQCSFHRAPILMAVEPHSMAWVAGQRGPDRSGERWRELVAQWPYGERVAHGCGCRHGDGAGREARQ